MKFIKVKEKRNEDSFAKPFVALPMNHSPHSLKRKKSLLLKVKNGKY
jgi:hypothetical protein